MNDLKGTPRPEIWQHTDESGRVLLVKCVGADGKGYGGFQWPKSGPVKPASWSDKPDCESGGLFGWAWGLNLGGGKDQDYSGAWIVFSARPEDLVDINAGEKQKVREAEVVYYGHWFGAKQFTAAGREAFAARVASWARENSRGASSAAGYSGASSATGYRGASSATGDSGASSATGYRGASSATGYRGAAIVTGEESTIEVAATGVAVAMARVVFWRYRAGAILIQRWVAADKTHPHVALQNLDGVTDGQLLRVEAGQWSIVEVEEIK